jgi:predicted nucleotidyltransferase component of viral defense system
MLQTQTVEPGTLSLLNELMSIPEIDNFLLVGGTALSLYYGHRMSMDLDLFSPLKFDNEDIIRVLEKKYKSFEYGNRSNPVGVFGFIDNIKVDFVQQCHHPLIGSPVFTEGIRLFNKEDIVAMKVNAVMKRGVKKDFWDIAELLHEFSMEDFIRLYEKKYPSQQLIITVPQAISYFDDAEESEEPVSLKGQTWKGIKRIIQQKVSEYLR